MAKFNFTFSKVRKAIARVTDTATVELPNNGALEFHRESEDEVLTFVWAKDKNYVKGFRLSEYADMGTYSEGIARTVRKLIGDVNVDGMEMFTALPKEPKVKKAATKRNKAKKEAAAAIA